MRICAVLFCALLALPVTAATREHDFSVWTKVSDGKVTVIPWWTTTPEHGLAVDARFNFDAPNGFGIFIGNRFGNEKLSVIPYVGFIDGQGAKGESDLSGESVQVSLIGSRNRLSVFLFNQYAWMKESDWHTDAKRRYGFVYHWGDFSCRISKRWAVSLGEQLYQETDQRALLDVGPAAKIFFADRFYGRLWVTVDPLNDWNHKVFAGVGVAWSADKPH